jgi:hypothetical protein
MNLHVIAHGDYDPGVFAYNVIRRGWRYGLRIVGSLKSQPALNVWLSTTSRPKGLRR